MSNEVKAKRAAKRYPYVMAGTCQFGANLIDIQLMNVSRSGIQFASRTQITTKETIRLHWKDSKFGEFNPTVLIAREIHKPENRDLPYYYGSQYCTLDPKVKENLLVFLKAFKDQDKQEVKKQVEKITPKYLFEVIDQGSSFLRRAFDGVEVPAYFDNIFKDIKDYERLAFSKDDEISICIQKLATHNFHCNLFGMLAPFMTENSALQVAFFSNVQLQIQKISETETESEAAVKKIMASEGREDDKRNVQRMMNESNNRLFYTKQGLLQSIVDTFVNIDSNSMEFKNTFGKIKQEHDRILEFTNSSFLGEKQVHIRRAKKPEEYSKADAIIDVPVMNYDKPRYLLWFNIFIIFIFIAGFGFYKFNLEQTRSSLKDQIGIEIDVSNFKRMGTQIDLTVPTEDWKKLPVLHKNDTFNKIVVYLFKDKSARSCILYDSDRNIIKILYEDMKPIE
jgi:hypothetical protein